MQLAYAMICGDELIEKVVLYHSQTSLVTTTDPGGKEDFVELGGTRTMNLDSGCM